MHWWPVRARLEIAALAVALLAIAAFLISFALGLGRSGGPAAAIVEAEPRRGLPEAAPPIGRVEVLNASRRAGVARHATDRLRAAGFDVVFFGNAPAGSPDSSVVIDRIGRSDVARAAADRLGISRTDAQRDTTLLLDATVILGVDYAVDSAAETRAKGDDGAVSWRERFRRRWRH
jgi:hypothetical protein